MEVIVLDVQLLKSILFLITLLAPLLHKPLLPSDLTGFHLEASKASDKSDLPATGRPQLPIGSRSRADLDLEEDMALLLTHCCSKYH